MRRRRRLGASLRRVDLLERWVEMDTEKVCIETCSRNQEMVIPGYHEWMTERTLPLYKQTDFFAIKDRGYGGHSTSDCLFYRIKNNIELSYLHIWAFAKLECLE